MICVVSYVKKGRYKEKFVKDKQFNNLKKEAANDKIQDLVVIGTQIEISEFINNIK